ncbi:MAG: hypothetical protein H6739_42420 [Alphaproteobacteria bacterium]|nr:hypothetical protein [Alphaproteobacteria bacterium]
MTRTVLAALATFVLCTTAQANTGWDYEWEGIRPGERIQLLQWANEAHPNHPTSLQVQAGWAPPDAYDFCVDPKECSETERIESWAYYFLDLDPGQNLPANLPNYPLGCTTDCVL